MSMLIKFPQAENLELVDALRQNIIEHLSNRNLNIDEILSHFIYISAKPGEQLLKKGEVCDRIYFIAKGCVQVYAFDVDGNESVKDIIIENNWCSELLSFGCELPAAENIKTVEPTELFYIRKKSFQKLMKTTPQFDQVYKQILEAAYVNSVYRINTFLNLQPSDRIKWLKLQRPELLDRLPGYLLASYLDINKDTLTEITNY